MDSEVISETETDDVLTFDVSDDALERAASADGQAVTCLAIFAAIRRASSRVSNLADQLLL